MIREPEGLSHPGDDRLLDLALGLLPPEAARTEREHLASCPACAERLRECAASHARASSQAATRVAPLAGAPLGAGVKRSRGGSRRGRWLALAAGFVAIAGGLALLRPLTRAPGWSTETPALSVPEMTGLTRDEGGAPDDSMLRRGLEAYARADFEGARRALASASFTGAEEQARRVYLGSALLELGRAAEAAAILAGIDPIQVAEPWRGEARWMLAQALERSGRRASADSLLRVLAEVPNAVGERARRALERR